MKKKIEGGGVKKSIWSNGNYVKKQTKGELRIGNLTRKALADKKAMGVPA